MIKTSAVTNICHRVIKAIFESAFRHSRQKYTKVNRLVQKLIDKIVDIDTFNKGIEEAFHTTDTLRFHVAFLGNHLTELRKVLLPNQIDNASSTNSTITPQAKDSSSGKRTKTSNTVRKDPIGNQIQHQQMVNYRKPLFDQSKGKFTLQITWP